MIVALVVAAVLAVTTGLSPTSAFLVGAMVAATDSGRRAVARSGSVRSPDAAGGTLVERESLLNDGTGIVLFALALGWNRRSGLLSGASSVFFVATIVISIASGRRDRLLAAWSSAPVDDHLAELTISVSSLAYGSISCGDRSACRGSWRR